LKEVKKMIVDERESEFEVDEDRVVILGERVCKPHYNSCRKLNFKRYIRVS